MFDGDDRRRLLTIARCALEARVRGQGDPVPEGGGALDTPCGAFVSIHEGHELRGCLGRLEADRGVAQVVAYLSRAVADSDPRFPPVAPHELTALAIEISVLQAEREMRSIDEITIGQHGLIIESGMRRGVLLPQVAAEHGWSVETFLEHTCLKAGVQPDAWRREARVLLFEAHVFNEHQEGIPSMIR